MNYPSENRIFVRILVKGFDQKTMSWTFFRSERVYGDLPRSHEVIAYDWKDGRNKAINVYVLEWHSLERVPIYELSIKQIYDCLVAVDIEMPQM